MVILYYLGEIWKDIPNFEGQYQASNYGRIKSHKFGKEKILKLRKTIWGYLVVGLYKNGKQITYFVHRLVWSAFHGEIPEGYEINHKDEDKTNNRLDNLELVTRKENNNYGTRNERAAKTQTNRKDLSKPVFQYTLEGELVKEWESQKEVERQLGYLQSNISNCCLGKQKQSYNYIWKYKNEDNCLPS